MVIDALSFNHKGRYNLQDYILFNGLFTKMERPRILYQLRSFIQTSLFYIATE